jgi:hypothetical protein
MNKYAQRLGRLARGVPKTITSERRASLRKQMAEARKHRWLATIPASLKRKIHDRNRIDQELEILWRNNGKPHGAAWKNVAAPLWDEQSRVEQDLAPLLLAWAEKNGCGRYGRSYFGFAVWQPAKDGYNRIAEHTGIKAQSHQQKLQIRALLLMGGMMREEEANKKRILAMSDEEFERDFCTRTDEGKRLKEVFLKLRAETRSPKPR